MSTCADTGCLYFGYWLAYFFNSSIIQITKLIYLVFCWPAVVYVHAGMLTLGMLLARNY